MQCVDCLSVGYTFNLSHKKCRSIAVISEIVYTFAAANGVSSVPIR